MPIQAGVGFAGAGATWTEASTSEGAILFDDFAMPFSATTRYMEVSQAATSWVEKTS